MDFGVLGFDGVVGLASSSSSSDPHETKQTLFGSGLFSNKHERSCNNISNDNSSNEEDGFCRSFKAARTDKDEQQKNNNSDNCTFVLKPNDAPYLFSECHPPQKMLSFSCPNKSEPQNAAFPCLPFTPASYTYSRYTDWNRGPFTASQKMELEQQAMIYKYLSANMPVPSNLLLPIRNAFISAGYSSFLPGLSRPTSWGWGTFHLGYSNSTDPEPGRCRRTDGKKWRCSRDAVPDHKYCERHMNRGRHRSRKPVEGHQQLPAHSSTTTTTNTAAAAATATTVSSASTRPISTSGLTSVALPTSTNRMFMNQEKPNSQFKESPFLIPEHQNPFEQASQTELGFMCSDSLLNTSSHNIKASVSKLPEQESSHNHPLLQFMDNFPRCRSSDSDHRQLLDFMSSTSSPNNENGTNTISPLRLSDQRQSNYFPTSWESSLGGPLGEVLHSGSSGDCTNNNRNNNNNNNSSSSGRANLAAVDGSWGGSSGQSSPRGVLLHRTVFGNSLSNSSAGSSPRTGDSYSKTHETPAAGLFCNNGV